MGENKFHFVMFLFGIIIFFGLILFADPNKIYEIILASEKTYLLLSSIFLIIGLLIRSGKIYIILKLFKNDVHLKRCFAYYVNSALYANIIPARMGESIVSLSIKRTDNIEIIKTFPLLFADKVLDLVVILFFFSIANIILFSNTSNVLIGVMVVVAISFPAEFNKKLQEMYNNFKSGFLELIKRPKYIAIFSFLTLVGWLPEFASFYFSVRAVGLDITYIQMVFLHSSALVVGIASLIPAGIGSFEISILALSTKFGFSKEMVIAGTLLYRFIAYVTLACLWMLMNRLLYHQIRGRI